MNQIFRSFNFEENWFEPDWSGLECAIPNYVLGHDCHICSFLLFAVKNKNTNFMRKNKDDLHMEISLFGKSSYA